MNEKVQQFIERRKKENDEERKKLLARIPELQTRVYSGHEKINAEFPFWDNSKNQSFTISTIEVSDDDFEAMKKYLLLDDGNKVDENTVKPSNAADKTLSALAKIYLILAFAGLIVGFVGLIDVGSYSWNPTTLIVGFSSFVVFLIGWATLRLLVNISVRLRQINNNLNKSL